MSPFLFGCVICFHFVGAAFAKWGLLFAFAWEARGDFFNVAGVQDFPFPLNHEP